MTVRIPIWKYYSNFWMTTAAEISLSNTLMGNLPHH